MCLIGLRFDAQGQLFLTANRDEFAHRPTKALHWWDDAVLAGRDLKSKGTWCGITRDGRFAAVTNVRDPRLRDTTVPYGSRGLVVSRFLQGDHRPADYLNHTLAQLTDPSPFNLLVGWIRPTGVECWWLGGRSREVRSLTAGVHVLSNAELNTAWPKTEQLRHAMSVHDEWLDDAAHESPIGRLMQSQECAADHALPETGIGYAWEKRLSAPFITGPDYHTLSSTEIRVRGREAQMSEITWSPQGEPINRVTKRFLIDSYD